MFVFVLPFLLFVFVLVSCLGFMCTKLHAFRWTIIVAHAACTTPLMTQNSIPTLALATHSPFFCRDCLIENMVFSRLASLQFDQACVD